VLVPQCPLDTRWVDTDWTLDGHQIPEKPSMPLQLSKELLDETIKNYPVDPQRIYVTGLSMGGYGALRLGAKYPQVFQGFSGLSSITQFEQMAQFVSNFAQLQKDALEQDGVLEWLVKNRTQLPPFRFDCGSEDILIDANRQLHAALIQQGIAHVYEEFPGGHEWPYWELHLEDSLKFFNECLKV
jgi:S-formylglutathione hydrolase FrmB